jgi:hypothetical protein
MFNIFIVLDFKIETIPSVVIEFFNLLNPSDHIIALELTQPLKEASATNLLEDNRRPARKADNLTAICKPIT